MGTFDEALRPVAPADALIAVDVQNDFLPGGSLAVADGDAVVAPLNAWLAHFAAAGCITVASRDWHPPDHCSFVARGGRWPMHCVAGTDGAAFAPGLALPDACLVVDKGTHRDREAYSAFDGTALGARLVAAHVRRLWVAGLATDYCVAATARDALTAGLEVVVLTDAVRGVDVARDDSERTLTALRAEGVQLHPGGPPKRDS